MDALLTEIYELGMRAIEMEREEQLRHEMEKKRAEQEKRDRAIDHAWMVLRKAEIADIVEGLSIGTMDFNYKWKYVSWELKVDFGQGIVSFNLEVLANDEISIKSGDISSSHRIANRLELAKALVNMYEEVINQRNRKRIEEELWRQREQEQQRIEEEQRKREQEEKAELERRQREIWKPFYVYRVYYRGDGDTGDTEDWIDCLHASPDAEGWWDAIKQGARVSQIRICQPLWIERRVEAEPTNWVYRRDDGLYYPPEGAEFVDSGASG